MTWILRGGGFLLMFIGLLAIFKPISVFGDVIPLVGTMLGAGLGVFAFLLAFALSIVTIAVSWIFVRPLLGIALLVLALGGLFWLLAIGRKKKRQRMGRARAAPAASAGLSFLTLTPAGAQPLAGAQRWKNETISATESRELALRNSPWRWATTSEPSGSRTATAGMPFSTAIP